MRGLPLVKDDHLSMQHVRVTRERENPMLKDESERLARELRGVIDRTRFAGFHATAEAMQTVLQEMERVSTRFEAAHAPSFD